MKVAGATGESKNAAYKEWTDCQSFVWGATQPSSMERGGGGGAGKVQIADCVVTALVDKAYPALLIKCASGEHIDKVEIAGAKAGGDQVEYFKITLEKVMVTSVSVNGSDGAEIVASYGLQAAKLKSEYSVQTEQGGKGATSTFSWDVKENKKA